MGGQRGWQQSGQSACGRHDLSKQPTASRAHRSCIPNSVRRDQLPVARERGKRDNIQSQCAAAAVLVLASGRDARGDQARRRALDRQPSRACSSSTAAEKKLPKPGPESNQRRVRRRRVGTDWPWPGRGSHSPTCGERRTSTTPHHPLAPVSAHRERETPCPLSAILSSVGCSSPSGPACLSPDAAEGPFHLACRTAMGETLESMYRVANRPTRPSNAAATAPRLRELLPRIHCPSRQAAPDSLH